MMKLKPATREDILARKPLWHTASKGRCRNACLWVTANTLRCTSCHEGTNWDYGFDLEAVLANGVKNFSVEVKTEIINKLVEVTEGKLRYTKLFEEEREL